MSRPVNSNGGQMWCAHKFTLSNAYHFGLSTVIVGECVLCAKEKTQSYEGVRLDAYMIEQLATGLRWRVTKEIMPG